MDIGSACKKFGDNAYDIRDVEVLFDVEYTPEQKTFLESVEIDNSLTKQHSNDFLLFPGFPFTILELRKIFPSFFCGQGAIEWYDCTDWASRITIEPKWYMLRYKNLPQSSYTAVHTVLGEGEELPATPEIVYAMVLYRLATGNRLFTRRAVRCREEDPWHENFHIAVRHTSDTGLIAMPSVMDEPDMAVAPIRKLG